MIAPVRSTSALVLSSTNINRERIYVQQPPISAAGFSSQAFAPHFPHTVRTTETKTCTDCHVSAANDNNAIMAQLLLQGTNFVNFVGLQRLGRAGGRLRGGAGHRMGRAAGGDRLLSAALRLSRLLPAARRAEPSRADQLDARRDASTATCRARPIRSSSSATSSRAPAAGSAACRFAANICSSPKGEGGFRVYDVAAIANKGFSERIVTAPVLAARPGHARRARATRPAWRCRPTSRSRPSATGDGADDGAGPTATSLAARRQPGAAVPPDLQLCGGHRRRGGPDPGQRRHARRRRPAQQLPAAAR